MATRLKCERLLFLIMIVFLSLLSISKAKSTRYVTCGSVIKLLNIGYNVRLHSHDIKYGSGSGQQSVTGTETKEDGNSYWLVKGVTGKHCNRGKPISCGHLIRLEHVATKKNLHSHHVSSPLSGKQEVSAYGDPKGEGDSGDHWTVVCTSDYWEREEPVILNHIDTDTYLSVSGRTYGNPISGQVEVVADYTSGSGHTQWQAMEGLYIDPQDFKSLHHPHTEL